MPTRNCCSARQRAGDDHPAAVTLSTADGTELGAPSGTEVRMRLAVLGGGVIGSVYAGRLAAAGHEVAVLARGHRGAELREHGLILQDAVTGHRTTTPVEVLEALDGARDL